MASTFHETLEHGFSLLECILVLLVLTMLTLGGLNQYHQYQKKRSLEALRQNVVVLKEASRLFYHHQCVRTDLPFKDRFELEKFNIEQVRAVIPFQLLLSDLVHSTATHLSTSKSYEVYADLLNPPIYLPKGANEQDAKIILYSYRLKLKVALAEHL